MGMKVHKDRLMAVAVGAAVGLATAALASSCGGLSPGNGGGIAPASASTTPPARLVYICPNVQAGADTQPCQPEPANPGDKNLFEVYDGYGNPIVSVAPYGGLAVDGDNVSVFPAGSVFHPAVVLSWLSPWGYARTHTGADTSRCVWPSKWIAPQGTWVCRKGTWERIGR